MIYGDKSRYVVEESPSVGKRLPSQLPGLTGVLADLAPTELHFEYYRQRATAFILTEST
jgi:hypothetical protein